MTGADSGFSVGSYDIDGGYTKATSPAIELPDDSSLTLSFSYYFSHYSNSSSDDYFKVSVIDSNGNSTTVFEELGASSDQDASWSDKSVDLSSFAGQTINLQIEAADEGSGSLVEAAFDDVVISSN
ncbi:choice-of-anchor J domain-containing protein [Bacillus carboniphilus]|uniref:Choice-of-anchor J domain-containing protein n=1 Tax=Bacillus carboniphilus TaxID=86663 RepID=A0ABY9K0Q8_9BACI|nr:choice-of-anchor J domain-containing protein [Bacillus carboniphilus]WLR43430.1 choice-of-anchor J domain-containing protein [Bacillus carboniphilus]